MDRRAFATTLLLGPLAAAGFPSAAAAKPDRIDIRMDYRGAEALLAALDRSTITDAEIDRLLAVRGLGAMVDNTTKYVPTDTREVFGAAIKEFVSTRKTTIRHFGLKGVAAGADD